jgi:hypothetical protein
MARRRCFRNERGPNWVPENDKFAYGRPWVLERPVRERNSQQRQRPEGAASATVLERRTERDSECQPTLPRTPFGANFRLADHSPRTRHSGLPRFAAGACRRPQGSMAEWRTCMLLTVSESRESTELHYAWQHIDIEPVPPHVSQRIGDHHRPSVFWRPPP